jgi:hypothetical protein
MARVAAVPEARWSGTVGEAAWIGERLAPFEAHRVASVIPGGFEACARVLHPAGGGPAGDGPVVRWRDVAAWSGGSVDRLTQFHSIALPPVRPPGEPPWRGRGPLQGTPHPPDAVALAQLLGPATSTPERCLFCLWDGYGWERGTSLLTRHGEAPVRLPGPIPERVLTGPRVRLPRRDYLLYTGPVEAVIATALLGERHRQAANVWWPADRAWCVASEIDLAWTYVGGTAAAIDRLLADPRLEAVPAAADDPLTRVEEWVQRWVDAGAETLLATGQATIATSMGTIEAVLERPRGRRPGRLRIHGDGRGSDGVVRHAGSEGLRRTVSVHLTHAVIELVGG